MTGYLRKVAQGRGQRQACIPQPMQAPRPYGRGYSLVEHGLFKTQRLAQSVCRR